MSPETGVSLTELDKRVLTRIQAGFPISPAPYADIAEALSLEGHDATEAQVLESVSGMRDTAVIRRIGAIFDSHRLGYRSTLCAIAVSPERVEEVAAFIGSYPNVTHNYLREDRYNVWFTLIARSQERIAGILGEIAEETGIDDILDLPALRLFKIRVDFDLTGERQAHSEAPATVRPAETVAEELSAEERELVRMLQADLPAGERPFEGVRERLWEAGADVSLEWVLDTARRWVDEGVIRRFGAAIKHHKTGFTANAMGVWDCPEERVEEVGRTMASFKEVSHCYQRPRLPQWPANMYTMIHARSKEDVVYVAARIREATGLPEPRLLYSTREFKKSSMRYLTEDE